MYFGGVSDAQMRVRCSIGIRSKTDYYQAIGG